jgi:salicylate hydroxylase
VAYPISQGKAINFAAFHVRSNLENTPYEGPWTSCVDKDEFLNATSQWEPEVQALLSVGFPTQFAALLTLAVSPKSFSVLAS